MQDSDPPITVLLVDDHPVVRDGYRRLLESSPDIRVAAEADDGETGCAHYKKFAPDVVILDLSMPGIGGLETIRRIKSQDPHARILVFSMHGSETMIRHALGAGAMGYLTKKCGAKQMVMAVRRIVQGKPFVDPEYVPEISGGNTLSVAGDPLDILSKREFQIFKMLAEGHTTSGIAATISISPKTVSVHHANIMKKLGLQNISQIVRLALRNNVIEP